METVIILDPSIMSWTYAEFEAYHKRLLSHDTLTAPERWVKSGGKLPDKVKK
jgi:hypothetical protein